MNIATIRVAAPISDDNPNGFVVINHADFDAVQHEPFDDEARDALDTAAAERLPTVAELLAARDQLDQRAAGLDAERAQLDAQRDAQAETQRLLDEAAKAAANATDQAEKLSVGQIRDALTAKGIAFDSTAKKADLQVLLDAAQVAQ